jgi:rhomboid protease GluP
MVCWGGLLPFNILASTTQSEAVRCSLYMASTQPRAGQTFDVVLVCNRLPDIYSTDLDCDGMEMLSTVHTKSEDGNTYTYTYELRAPHGGDYTVGCSKLSFDGVPYPLTPIRLTVAKAALPWIPILAVLLPLLTYIVLAGRFSRNGKKHFSEFVRRTGRMNLRVKTAHRHFRIPFCLLLIPFLTGSYILTTYLTGDPFLPKGSIIAGLIILPLLLSGIGIYIQYRRLFFVPVKTQLTIGDIYELIAVLGSREQWTCNHPGQDYYSCRTNPGKYHTILGEQIYLVFDEGKVWVNSICDLEKSSFGSTFGRTRRNIRLIEDGIRKWETGHLI